MGGHEKVGYDKLAAFVGDNPEMSIYRRFSTLGAKNILYLQAELVNLEAQLEDIIREDKDSGDEKKKNFPYSVWHLKGLDPNEGGNAQWLKVLEIRQTLKEYYDALLQQYRVSKFEEANKPDLKELRDWLERKKGGNYFLQGREADPWQDEDKHTKDLISLISHHREKDFFTSWIRDKFLTWFHDGWGHRFKEPVDEEKMIYNYKESKINTAANAISAVISSLLPTSTIFVLYYLQNHLAKLGAIVAFTTLFSLALVIIAKARRIDAFAAATA
ncbi:hypothetical protein GP486_002433 [Trichoglossum hirsutum]|uniref:DUF6594 domain-containing protein n=1 Tax=Trichoglossum hirsutum TaxID=265104 RepID=A0A9P8LEY5_9PEZI|nr:hypothetical protein GP486_002433 [Trichoglossum hirsutum]